MDDKAKAIYDYISERCLWQFFSRNWDRERNINSIMVNLGSIFCGEAVAKESQLEKCYYADAKVLLEQLMDKYSWMAELDGKEMKKLCEQVREKLIDVAVVNSLNTERVLEFY